MSYIPRKIEEKLKFYVKQFPVVVVTGPRQSGKSTLLKHLFVDKKEWQYITLDERGTLERIQSDPDLFVRDISTHCIIDEAQKAPALFHAIKYLVDKDSSRRIILSGSANFHLLSQVSETLAGRAGVLELFPFSCNEIFRPTRKEKGILDIILTETDIKKIVKAAKTIAPLSSHQIMEYLLFGGYPKLQEYKHALEKITWFENYRSTYIERDLRDLSQVADITIFQHFYQIIAFQIANMLNLSNIANELGISVPTAKKFLHILETSYQYFLLHPFHANIRKRLIKTPKVYSIDIGLVNFFLRNTSQEMMKNSPQFGAIFENFVISEIIKHISLGTWKNQLYFWRTSNGAEIDTLIEKGQQLIPIEIKSAIKLQPHSLRGLFDFLDSPLGKKAPFSIIMYRGEEIYHIKENILAIPVTLV